MTDHFGSSGKGRDDKLRRIEHLLATIEECLSSQLASLGQGRLTEVEEIADRVKSLMLELKGLSTAPFPFPGRLAQLGKQHRLLMLTTEQRKQSLSEQMRRLRIGRKLTKTYA